MEPPGPIEEGGRHNVSLFCEVAYHDVDRDHDHDHDHNHHNAVQNV